MDKCRLTFLGGAGTVTGSKTLVNYQGVKALVDCGLFQGLKALRNKNRALMEVPASEFDAVLLTHAHLDHCGYLPLLVKEGFNGPIHCTRPTYELARVVLLDSAKIQEEEAERANRHGYSRHQPAKPLYTIKDVERTLPLFDTHNYEEWVLLRHDFKFKFVNNGHILGSSFIEIHAGKQTILFSGDIGRKRPLLLYPPERFQHADALILESTYGDRLHPEINAKDQLEEIIKDTWDARGILLIPTFAIERAQELIFLLSQLRMEGRLPPMQVYLDSPMGIDATQIMMDFPTWHNISKEKVKEMQETVKLIRNAEVSRAIVADKSPKIVLAGSGMVSGGRILHYLANHVGNPNNTVLLAGFQAAGTRGRTLSEGGQEIKLFGKYYPVKARIVQMGALSAHADQAEIVEWLRNFKSPPGRIFLNHGEPHQTDALRVKLKSEFGWECEIAEMDDIKTIGD
jgi:metallo-beta-lactamase family protein